MAVLRWVAAVVRFCALFRVLRTPKQSIAPSSCPSLPFTPPLLLSSTVPCSQPQPCNLRSPSRPLPAAGVSSLSGSEAPACCPHASMGQSASAPRPSASASADTTRPRDVSGDEASPSTTTAPASSAHSAQLLSAVHRLATQRVHLLQHRAERWTGQHWPRTAQHSTAQPDTTERFSSAVRYI